MSARLGFSCLHLQVQDWQSEVRKQHAEEEAKLKESIAKLVDAIMAGRKRPTVKKQILAERKF